VVNIGRPRSDTTCLESFLDFRHGKIKVKIKVN
jgi:hypothetical protein